ncbi:putative reverse transcriptase domain-containing protein [Tanacetum coccineum]
MLFDSGADRSFVSTTFSALLDVAPTTLDTSYAVELADGRISETNIVLRGCTLGLLGHPFDIDLMPVELGSFDVIIGMDWLAKYHALIVCDEKTQKYIEKGCQVYLAQVTSKKAEDKSEERRLKDVPIVREFPEVFPEDLLSKSRKEHEGHLKLILNLLKKEELYAKFSKCEFWLSKVQFLGHMIDSEGIRVDPTKIEAIKDWASPKTPTEIRQFLEKAEAAFQLLKQKLCSAPILALPEVSENFVVYCDASHKGLGAVLMQRKNVIAYASHQLKVHEKNYTTRDLELGAVVFALKMWRHYLYGTKCVVFTDHKSLQHILDQKELNMRSKPLRVRALVMTIGLNPPKQILSAQSQKVWDVIEPLNENAEEQEGENGGNGNGGNRGNGNGGNGENGNRGNGHKNGNHGMNYGGFMPVARECTFQDFLKCKPDNFSGTKGVVGLTRWFEKMETVFNISNCPSKYQVKYATCTLQDNALTWWNSHKRTIGVEAAYAMNWVGLMRLMTEVYCLRNEIQKMETKLWNLTVKATTYCYTQRFQELVLLCTRMVPNEEDRVERFIGGLPDNIQGNVIAANPARL